MNVLDLFSGIGGFSLGLERAGMRTLAFCESDSDCVAVLRDQWPHVPVFGDVRTLSVEAGFVDLICGGFPCQPFSTAARGRNNAIDRWPEFIRIVREADPTWVLAENVLGIGAQGVDRVCSDLEESGYTVWPLDVDVALPQRQRGRHRIVWVAHANRKGEPRFAEHAEVAGIRLVSGYGAEDDSSPLGMDDELPGRMDRLYALGNAIPPTFVEALGSVILRAAHS